MSKKREINKDLNGENQNEDRISSGRRQFTKTGLLAPPVIMTVVSRPVFAVNCLSNMLSGNLSEPDRGECNLGLSPGYWKAHPEAWPSPLLADKKSNGNYPHQCNECLSQQSQIWSCSGGSLFNSFFLSGAQDPSNRSMYQILCEDSGSAEFHIIGALLNAMTDPHYVLSVAQVYALWADPTLGGQITDFNAFLDSTWT